MASLSFIGQKETLGKELMLMEGRVEARRFGGRTKGPAGREGLVLSTALSLAPRLFSAQYERLHRSPLKERTIQDWIQTNKLFSISSTGTTSSRRANLWWKHWWPQLGTLSINEDSRPWCPKESAGRESNSFWWVHFSLICCLSIGTEMGEGQFSYSAFLLEGSFSHEAC